MQIQVAQWIMGLFAPPLPAMLRRSDDGNLWPLFGY